MSDCCESVRSGEAQLFDGKCPKTCEASEPLGLYQSELNKITVSTGNRTCIDIFSFDESHELDIGKRATSNDRFQLIH